MGYLGSAHLNVCFWSHPGGSFGQSLGQMTAILCFSTVIQSLMTQIFYFLLLFFFAASGDEVFQEQGSSTCIYASVSAQHSLWVIH